MSLNGTTAYVEAPHHAELTLSSWTFELWFKDENASYNHTRTRILTKGDSSFAEVPYFASVDTNLLHVGLRAGGVARVLSYDLATGGVSPGAWHHLAASFNSTTRQLTIYIDGTQRAQGILSAASLGNTLPLIIGRSGTGGQTGAASSTTSGSGTSSAPRWRSRRATSRSSSWRRPGL